MLAVVFTRVFDWVIPGFFFFLQPGPVPALGRLGLKSIHRARPGFKTMVFIVEYNF